MKHQKDARWPTTSPKYGSLPPSSGNSYHSVPSWEIQFCSQIPWTKFCECQKLAYLFDNVLTWDDSAGKEAFDNAKTRYWAEINGFQCDIPLPDPDMYIDVVTDDTSLDPRLVEDLYKLPPPPPPKEVPDFDSVVIIPTGWDVEDPDTTGATIPIFISTGDDQSVPCGNNATTLPTERSRVGYPENCIDSRPIDEPVAIVPTGWGDEEELDSGHVNLSGTRKNSAFRVDSHVIESNDANFVSSSFRNSTKDRGRGNGRGFGPRFSSRYATGRHHGEYYRVNDSSRDCGGAKKRYSDEYRWQGKGLSCAPGNHH